MSIKRSAVTRIVTNKCQSQSLERVTAAWARLKVKRGFRNIFDCNFNKAFYIPWKIRGSKTMFFSTIISWPETLFLYLNRRRNLGSKSSRVWSFMGNNAPASFFHRVQDGLSIPGKNWDKVNHLAINLKFNAKINCEISVLIGVQHCWLHQKEKNGHFPQFTYPQLLLG